MASFVYDSAKEYIVDGTIALKTHAFKLMLLADAHTPDKAAHAVKADVVGNEVNGAGYSAGGFALANVVLTRSGATVKFDADDITAMGLAPDWRYAVVYDDTHASDALVALLDPGSLQEPAGGNFILTLNAAGIVTLTDG